MPADSIEIFIFLRLEEAADLWVARTEGDLSTE